MWRHCCKLATRGFLARSTREANALNNRKRKVHNCAICVKGTRKEIQSSTFKRADGTPGFGNDSPVCGSTTGGSASTFTVFAIKTKLVPDISVESRTYMFDSFRVISSKHAKVVVDDDVFSNSSSVNSKRAFTEPGWIRTRSPFKVPSVGARHWGSILPTRGYMPTAKTARTNEVAFLSLIHI